jgi:hypothetical protein
MHGIGDHILEKVRKEVTNNNELQCKRSGQSPLSSNHEQTMTKWLINL